MKVGLTNHIVRARLQTTNVARGQQIQILALVALFLAHFLDLALYNLCQFHKHREKRQNAHQNDQGITDLHVVLGVEAENHCLGDLVVPFVAYVAVVFVAHEVISLC